MPQRRNVNRASSAQAVQAVPLHAPNQSRGHTKANTPATKRWHQGFGQIMVDGRAVVPFASIHTARAIAQQAARNTKMKMIIIALPDGCWGYSTALKGEK